VEGVHAHTQVEGFLARKLRHVLVRSNTGSLKGLTADILFLPTERSKAGAAAAATPPASSEAASGSNQTDTFARLLLVG
jgi:hypothetical protein